MSLRGRLVVLCALAVAVAVVAAAIGSYLAVRGELRGQIDDVLEAQTGALEAVAGPEAQLELPLENLPQGIEPPLLPPGQTGVEGQLIAADGTVETPSGEGEPKLPVSDADLAIAQNGTGARLVDADVDGEPYRVITSPLPGSGAIQIGRSLAGVEGVLSNLQLFLAVLVAGGIATAAGLAWLVSRRVIAPITRLTEAAEHVSETEDLSRRIASPGGDELGRLAIRFNAMLETIERSQGELSDSVTAQRQLVADASHELRTPVASLRTDIESLLGHPELGQVEREERLRAADARLMELTDLIADVIELARGHEQSADPEEIRFHDLVAESVERMEQLAPGRSFRAELEPSVVVGEPDRIARAVNNLLDNACKYSPPTQPVEVVLRAGVLSVHDSGPGIEPSEVAHVFDRFYRGRQARNKAGSGLGLAIVSQVARSGGGDAWVESRAEGGAAFSFRPGPAAG